MTHIVHIEIDDSALPPATPEIEQERKVAMFDILEKNTFRLAKRGGTDMPNGPYRLGLSIRDKRLVFDIETAESQTATKPNPHTPKNQ